MLVLIQLYFNSIKVRLEPFQNGLNNAVNQYFNSIKVRLERCRINQDIFVLFVFQFHKGTIRTVGFDGTSAA